MFTKSRRFEDIRYDTERSQVDHLGTTWHTLKLSFLLHGQDVWVNFCSTQNCVNRNKIDFASKQRKSQKGRKNEFVIWSNDKLLHIADVEQFVIAPHEKQLCHVVQNCLSCGASLI